FVDRVFAMMALTSQHTYQILTKRPTRMLEYLENGPRQMWPYWTGLLMGREGPQEIARAFDIQQEIAAGKNFPLKNVWLGVSIEDQKTANRRIPLLLQTPAAMRFVSYEPALEAVDFIWLGPNGKTLTAPSTLTGESRGLYKEPEASTFRRHLDWIIIGGETG